MNDSQINSQRLSLMPPTGVTCRKSYWKHPGDVGVRNALLKGNDPHICETGFVVIFVFLVFFIKKETSSATSSFIINTDGHKLVGINQDSPTVFSVKPQWDIIIVQKWKAQQCQHSQPYTKSPIPRPSIQTQNTWIHKYKRSPKCGCTVLGGVWLHKRTWQAFISRKRGTTREWE